MHPDDFGKGIAFEELATGGSMMIFGQQRNLLDVVDNFTRFFCHESCGFCTPCRVGNELMREKIEQIMAGRGVTADLEYLKELGETIKFSSRCGLGQTSPNPVLTSMEYFSAIYQESVRPDSQFVTTFSMAEATADAADIAGHKST